jgi:Arc/MetJ family transcription regulator
MRTNIDIDDKLMKAAMKATGAKTKRAAVEAALRKVIQLKKQERILRLFGKVQWEGDLDAMRESRFPEWHGLLHDAKQPDKDAA